MSNPQTPCLLVSLPDGREYALSRQATTQVIDFCETFGGEIWDALTATPDKLLTADDFALSICKENNLEAPTVRKKNKIFPDGKRKFMRTIRDLVYSGEPVSLEKLETQFSDKPMSRKRLATAFSIVRKDLEEKGLRFGKMAAGQYRLIGTGPQSAQS